MALSLIPFAIGFLLALLMFIAIRRTGRLPPEFSSIAAAIMFAPILVGAVDTVTTSVLSLTDPPREQHAALTMLAGALVFSAVTFAPTLLTLVPLLTFYLVRAYQKKRLLPAKLMSAIGLCCTAVQIAWLNILANATD